MWYDVGTHRGFPMRLCVVVLCVGCNEYGITAKSPEIPEVIDTDVGLSPEVPPEVIPSCDDVSWTFGEWRASLPFEGPEDFRDSAGMPFWDVDFRDAELAPVVLPDVGSIPPGFDRVYTSTLEVSGNAPSWSMELQSDDGIAIWVDGVPVGAWGGRWQEEGCVNDAANCVQFELVDPVDITEHLTDGPHELAVRVSNPVESSYADVRLHCLELP